MEELMLDEIEKNQFSAFKKKLNLQTAQAQVAKVEYSLTNPTTEKSILKRACQDSNLLKLGGICVLPCQVRACVNFLGEDPQVSLISCVSFPYGGDSTKTKIYAVKNSFREGADEVEVSAPVPYIKEGSWGYIKREFKKLKKVGKIRTVRISIDSSNLTTQELIKTCNIALECGIQSLRISGGNFDSDFDGDTIALVKSTVKDKCTIKAEGITNIADMNMAVDMGASILGSKNAIDLARLILQVAEI